MPYNLLFKQKFLIGYSSELIEEKETEVKLVKKLVNFS